MTLFATDPLCLFFLFTLVDMVEAIEIEIEKKEKFKFAEAEKSI